VCTVDHQSSSLPLDTLFAVIYDLSDKLVTIV